MLASLCPACYKRVINDFTGNIYIPKDKEDRGFKYRNIIQRYVDGEKASVLAKEYGVTTRRILQIFNECGKRL